MKIKNTLLTALCLAGLSGPAMASDYAAKVTNGVAYWTTIERDSQEEEVGVMGIILSGFDQASPGLPSADGMIKACEAILAAMSNASEATVYVSGIKSPIFRCRTSDRSKTGARILMLDDTKAVMAMLD